MTRNPLIWLLLLLLILGRIAFAQASGPADPTLDWLMSQATTAPTTAPSVEPATRNSGRFAQGADEGWRPATLELSNGEKIRGKYTTTKDKPIRVWDQADKEYRDIPFQLIRSFQAKLLWQRDQPEWHFKDSGSDIKEFTGKTYPAHELQYLVTLVNGQAVTGGIVAPLYLDTPSGNKLFVLHKRDKGEVGQKLGDLVYVKQVIFEDTAPATGKATREIPVTHDEPTPRHE